MDHPTKRMTAQGELNVGVDVDWNNAAEQILALTVGLVPEAGPFLQTLVYIFWPSKDANGQTPWDQVKQQTETLINTIIDTETYKAIKSVLSGSTGDQGLIGVLQNFLNAGPAKDGGNGQDPKDTWISANDQFILQSGPFEKESHEIALLSLWAKMANLHLALLKLGSNRGFCDYSELYHYIDTYTRYGGKWLDAFNAGVNTGDAFHFDQWITSLRYMQLAVGDLVQLWPGLNSDLYPRGRKGNDLPINKEIFYSTRGVLNIPPAHGWQNKTYVPPPTHTGYLTQIDLYSLYLGLEGHPIAISGDNVFYDDPPPKGWSTNYQGVLLDYPPDTTYPPVGKPRSDGTVYSLTSIKGLSHQKTVTRVDGSYNWNNGTDYIRFLRFYFSDGTDSGNIPSTTDNSDGIPFSIKPPDGYFLSNIYMPNVYHQYQVTCDCIFGFRRGTYVDRTRLITIDQSKWNGKLPVDGSTRWTDDYEVQYAIRGPSLKGESILNIGEWSDPVKGSPNVFPTLNLPAAASDWDKDGFIQVYHQTHGSLQGVLGELRQ